MMFGWNKIVSAISGYGHIAPSTVLGKLFTMVYTVIGIPLFMLYVASIGDILARVFKWTYSRWEEPTRHPKVTMTNRSLHFQMLQVPYEEEAAAARVDIHRVSHAEAGHGDGLHRRDGIQ